MTPTAPGRPVFLFIVGSGRSGTTWLRSMFDAHPRIAVTHEAHFIPIMGRRRRLYERGAHGFDVQRFLKDLLADAKFRSLGLAEDELSAALTEPPPNDFADAVRRVFAFYASRNGKTRYGDKTPAYVLRIPLLAALFPEARFIHIIRDGRDVAASFSNRKFGPHNVGEAAVYWKRRVLQGRKDGRALADHRYREVHYEDLVQEPEAILTGLCAFADLDFDPAMLRYFEGTGPFLGSTGVPAAHKRLFLPPTAGLRDWRVELAPDDIRRFEAVAGNVLDEFGYDLTVDDLSLADRVEAWRIHAALQALRVRTYVTRTRGRPRPGSGPTPGSTDTLTDCHQGLP